MSKQLVIRNGFLLYANNAYTTIITGITDHADFVTQGNTLLTNDNKLITEYAVKDYVDNKFAESGTTSSGPAGTIQIADSSENFTGYTNFSYDGSILSVPNIDASGTISGDTAQLNTLFIDNTQITSIVEDIITVGDNNTLATTSAITSYVEAELSQFSTTLSGLTDTNINGLVSDDFLVYNGTSWVNTGSSYLQTLLDSVYVNVNGDTMTGSLTLDTGANLTLTQGDIDVQNGNVTIIGNLFVSGTTTTIDSDNLSIRDNIITINSGETGSGVTLNEAGIVVERGDFENYYFIYREDSPSTNLGGTFRVGTSGDTQAVATREDSPIDNGIAVWNNTEKRFDTDTNFTWNSGTTTLTVSGDITVSGNVDGVDISQFYSDFLTFTGTTNTLSALNDTNISGVAANDILQWDGSNWINKQDLDINGNITGSTLYSTDVNVSNNLNVNNISTFTGLVNIDGGLDASGQIITGLTIYTTNLTLGTGTQVNEITTTISGNIDDTTLATTQAIDTYVGQVIADSGVSILDNTANAVLTATGDNNELQANSGLSFDGTDLTISNFIGTGDRLVYADSTGKLVQTNEYVYKPDIVVAGTGQDTIDSVSTGITYGTVWHYYVQDGTNFRSGIITGVWGAGSIEMNETSTLDIGDTTTIDFNLILSGTTNVSAVLQSDVTSGTWNVKVVRMTI